MQCSARYLTVILVLLFTGHSLLAQEATPPVITVFTGNLETITPDAAESGAAPVALWWQTQGMRETDTLILQVWVLGTWHDVTLPDTLKPLPPSGTLDWIVPHTLTFDPPIFRLLLVDDTNRTLSEARYIIPYAEQAYAPIIETFSTTQTTLTRAELAAGVTIPVTWRVNQRPPNTNLVFEQITPTGNSLNIELPRDNPWIQSSGQGAVRPTQAIFTTDEIVLQLRLVNRFTRETLVRAELRIPISQPDANTEYPACPPDYGFAVGMQARVSSTVPESGPHSGLVVTSMPAPRGGIVGYLAADTPVTIISGPACFTTMREWQIRADNHDLVGWVQEFTDTNGTLQFNLVPDNSADNDEAPPEIVTFTVDNDQPRRGDTVTLSWQATHVDAVWIGYIDLDFSPISYIGPTRTLEPEGVFGPLPASGTYAFTTPADYPRRGMQIHIGASVDDIRNFHYTKRVDIRFADMVQPLRVNQFTLDRETIHRGEVLTITWDVQDTFDANDTLYVSYTGIIQGASMSPYVPQNGRLTGLPAVGSAQLTIPDFPPEYTGISFNIGRDGEPNTIYDANFVNMLD